MQKLAPYQKTAEVCARVYARDRCTSWHRFCLGYRPSQRFHVLVFSETFKVLGIQRIHTSSYHLQSNGTAERWHRTLHTGLPHLVNNSHTDWDVQLPFFSWRTGNPRTPPPATAHFICYTGEKYHFQGTII